MSETLKVTFLMVNGQLLMVNCQRYVFRIISNYQLTIYH